MRSGLSLAQAPPFSVPLRFFLTAPLFGVLLAIVQISVGPDAASQWTPATLAMTHLLTLGYISMVMIGAMSQILPVVVGSPLPKPLMVGSVVHVLLILGVLMLASGFLFGHSELILVAMFLLGVSLSIFIGSAVYSLVRAKTSNATVTGMRMAVFSLVVTVIIGLRVAAKHVDFLDLPLSYLWTHAHLAWGFVGWIGILVVSVAYEVVPMFQMTPQYPRWMQNWMTKMMLAGLLLWASIYLSALVADSATQEILTGLLSSFLAVSLAVFAVMTIYLQSKRRRLASDLTLKFWRMAMVSLLLCVGLWVAGQIWPSLGEWQNAGYLNGMLFIVGFVISVIIGLLYKIIPFLVWLHLQSQNSRRLKLPNMKEIILERRIRWHFYLHMAVLPLLVGAAINPVWFIYPAAVAFGLSSLLLFFNIFTALRIYHDFRVRLSEL